MVSLQRVMILEYGQYLESYTRPNFDPEIWSFENVMSMILLISFDLNFLLNLEAGVVYRFG
jgi:hypothetical protein